MDSDNVKFVELKSYDNIMQAEIAKSILDSAGILCDLHGEYMATIYTPVAFPARLMVREEDVAEAEAVLGIR